MSHQHFDESSSKKYTLTLFLSFAALFCFGLLMMLWQGDYKPGGEPTMVRVVHGPSDRKIDIRKESSLADSLSTVR